MDRPTDVSTQDLLALIGMKEVELNILRGQLAGAQQEIQRLQPPVPPVPPVAEKP